MINKFDGKYAFLSNFYSSPFVFKEGNEEFIAKTVEHYFQYMKTASIEEGIEILSALTPGEAKHLGRKCTLCKDWEEIKDAVMSEALHKKFAIPELKEKLLATGSEYLEEGNWWHDNTWGNCYCEKCKDIVGENRLGIILMRIREELK